MEKEGAFVKSVLEHHRCHANLTESIEATRNMRHSVCVFTVRNFSAIQCSEATDTGDELRHFIFHLCVSVK